MPSLQLCVCVIVQPSGIQAPDEWKKLVLLTLCLSRFVFFLLLTQPVFPHRAPTSAFWDVHPPSLSLVFASFPSPNPPLLPNLQPPTSLSALMRSRMTMNSLIMICSPSPRPGAPSQQVKREQEGREKQAGLVGGKENGGGGDVRAILPPQASLASYVSRFLLVSLISHISHSGFCDFL